MKCRQSRSQVRILPTTLLQAAVLYEALSTRAQPELWQAGLGRWYRGGVALCLESTVTLPKSLYLYLVVYRNHYGLL